MIWYNKGMSKVKVCPECSEEHFRRGVTCSNVCAASLRKKSALKTRACMFCGVDFKAGINEKFCSGPHYSFCENCDVKFEVSDVYKPPRTCSGSCASALTHSDEAREKRRRTSLERFGTEHPFQNEEIKKKIEGSLAGTAGRFGTEASKAAMLASLGVENASQLDEVKEKKRQASLKKYGTENVLQADEVKEKIRLTNLERYGVEFPAQSAEVQKKIRKTNLEKYGVESPFSFPEFQAKSRLTSLARYGVEFPMQNETVRDKARKTNQERYGGPNFMCDPAASAKMKATLFERYGSENYFSSEVGKKRIKAILKEKYGFEYPMQIPEVKKKAALTLEKNLANGSTKSSGRVSLLNVKIAKEIESLYDVEVTFEKFVDSFSYDLAVKGTNILIDVHPTVTHNSSVAFACIIKKCLPLCEVHPPISKSYHFDRAVVARKNGYSLVQVYDWDLDRGVHTLLDGKLGKDFKKISARKSELRKISQRDANRFLKMNHVQGASRGQKYCYGLYDSGELIAVATFSDSRFKSKAEWEFNRYAVRKNVIVHGGAGKLFKEFLKDAEPESVVSYIDFDHTTSDTTFLNSLGFEELKPTGPSTVWFNLKTRKRFAGTSLLSVGADRLLGTNYGSREESGLDNTSIMLLEGFLDVHSSGNRVFMFKKAT